MKQKIEYIESYIKLDDGYQFLGATRLIRCEDCKYNSNTEGNYVNCDIISQMFGKTPDNNYCSYAEPKDTTEEVRKQLKDMEQRREMDRKK